VSFSPVDQDGGGDEIVAEINVTPLTDIFLVLLIIFMVTSSAIMQQGTPVNLPRAGSGGAEAEGIVVTATADGQLEVNGQAVEREQLLPALAAALADSVDKRVVLQGDRQVILEDAVQIMTIAKEAGAEKIAIATEPAQAR
jgi:biopolymer transport protein ExbD